MASLKTRQEQPNILLFAIDSLLADHMSCYGYPRLTTPHLDKLAQQGTLFERTYSAHIPTTPAYSSMLTGWIVGTVRTTIWFPVACSCAFIASVTSCWTCSSTATTQV